METTQNLQIKRTAFVDYKPAELKKNKEWIIVYYAKNPIENKLQRIRVPVIKNTRERDKHAKKMCLKINSKLENNWSPFFTDKASNGLKQFKDIVEIFNKQNDKQVKDGSKRPQAVKSYKSFLRGITKFIADNKEQHNVVFCLDFNKKFIVSYLDYIYYEKANSPRTFNNHLLFIRTFSRFLVEREYIKEDPTTGIAKKAKTEKIRQVIPLSVREKIFKHLKENNFNYLVMCLCTYYCFIRRTELTKLKVRMVDLNKGYMIIPGSISKNRKTEDVTIPNDLIQLLKIHIGDSEGDDYLFSNLGFKTGKEQLRPDRIMSVWSFMRKRLKIETVYQFYSLKDTGITELLNSGIAAIKVRDQARHHDLKITESYTARNKGVDNAVQNINFNF